MQNVFMWKDTKTYVWQDYIIQMALEIKHKYRRRILQKCSKYYDNGFISQWMPYKWVKKSQSVKWQGLNMICLH